MINFPDTRQSTKYSCGASAVQSVLKYYDIDVPEDVLMKQLKTSSEDGTSIINIKKILKEYGLNFIDGVMSIQNLKRSIDENFPIIIPLQAWSKSDKDYSKTWNEGHYVVVVGYDKDKIYFEDPATKNTRNYLTHNELLERWHDQDDDKKYIQYGIVVFRKNIDNKIDINTKDKDDNTKIQKIQKMG